MLQEDFLPQKGFNSTFSELHNYELVQYPTERDGFFSETATAKKREGLYTKQDQDQVYLWKTEGAIQGKIIVGGTMFVWDDECHVYRFDKVDGEYVLTPIYANPTDEAELYTEDMYGRHVKQKAVCISYLNNFYKSFVADKDSSTNFDGENTSIVSTTTGTFTDGSGGPTEENMLGYYIYFPYTSTPGARGQIRQITEIPSGYNGTKAYLSQQFYGEPSSTWGANQDCEVYKNIEDVIVFNNIRRKTDGLVLTIGISNSEAHFRNLGGIDVELFEGRYWYINDYATAIGGSLASGEYEILDSATVRGSSIDSRGQKMNSLVLIKNYLLINMENSMSVIWKMATDDNQVDPIYNLNSIINGECAITPESIFFKGGLYFVNQDGLFEGGDVKAVSSNMIYGETTNQGETVQTWLNKIAYGDFVSCYAVGRVKIIQHVVGNKTQMLVYDDLYEGRLPWEYGMAIYDKFEKFYDDWVIGVGDKVCLKKGNTDLGDPISCKVTVVGSKNYINSLFSLKKIKLTLGFYENEQMFKVMVDLGYAVFEGHIEKDADGVAYLYWQNMALQNTGGMGLQPVGIMVLGGAGEPNGLANYIAKIGLIGIPIGKKCSYYKITFENIDNYDLNITGISVLTEGGNTYITPVVNVF